MSYKLSKNKISNKTISFQLMCMLVWRALNNPQGLIANQPTNQTILSKQLELQVTILTPNNLHTYLVWSIPI